ncbi:hypothetical protein IQ268_11175 [Oculatella sp. LEGE 06141]|nr:hypothetical protein [Oculatella sp. LEGE 06141]
MCQMIGYAVQVIWSMHPVPLQMSGGKRLQSVARLFVLDYAILARHFGTPLCYDKTQTVGGGRIPLESNS